MIGILALVGTFVPASGQGDNEAQSAPPSYRYDLGVDARPGECPIVVTLNLDEDALAQPGAGYATPIAAVQALSPQSAGFVERGAGPAVLVEKFEGSLKVAAYETLEFAAGWLVTRYQRSHPCGGWATLENYPLPPE